MAAARNPNMILFSLIVTVVLFGVFIGLSRLHVLERHAYVPEAGWQQPSASSIAASHGGCSYDPKTTSGFPLVYSRQADLPYTCLKAKNPLARSLNFAACFALGCVVAVGITELAKERL